MQIPKFSNYRFDNKEEVSTNVELLSRNFNNNFDMLSGTLSSLKSTVSKTNKYMQDLPVITGEEPNPNGSYTAKAGTIYRNKKGGASKTLWVKETEEDSNTGWSSLNTQLVLVTNITTATGTVTIPSGYTIGKRILVRKVNSTQGAVVINRSDTETFTRANLTSVELNADGDYWLFEKVTSTRWELVEGYETGSNANGNYKRFPDGQMNAWFRGSKTISAPYAYGSIYQGGTVVDYPITFIDSPAVHIGRTIWSSGAPWSTVRGDNTSSFTYNLFDIVARAARSEVISWSALGRWYA